MSEDVWVVVRCKSSTTLDLEASLTEGGLSAWTPASYRKRRLPRRRTTVLEREAILPSFVFVRQSAIDDQGGMGCLEKHFVKALTTADGTVIRVRDVELTGLREACVTVEEDRPTPAPDIGSCWKFLCGAFSGLLAYVVEVNGTKAKMSLDNGSGMALTVGYVQLNKTAIRMADATPNG